MLVLPYNGQSPRLGERVFVAPNATLIGDVELGDDASIWFGTVLRADVNPIRVGARTNIQDNCVVHVTNETWPTIIGDDVTIGHAAIVHGCTIGAGALIGMGSRVLDGAVVGSQALVGAGALVPEGMIVPPRTLVVGVPAKVKRPLTDEEIARLAASATNYVNYKDKYR
ncbi:MAG TPA: gamma carbonic anhydrase family protein [Thermoanaerobaculia bacterium]|nr:gamma carbonic anhydrase family protein [Thermoanaerobaculia bacterium]